MSITDEERIAIVNYRIEKSYNTYNIAHLVDYNSSN